VVVEADPEAERDGKKEIFTLDKLKKSLSYAVKGHEDEVDIDAIVKQTRSELYEGMKTKDIAKALIMVTRSFIEQDPAYSQLASRLLLSRIYKDAIGNDNVDFSKLEEQHKNAFEKNLKLGIEAGKIDEKLLDFDIKMLAGRMDTKRDDLLKYLGVETLHDRYFIKIPESKRILETPQMMWMRVAMGLAMNEKEKEKRALEFYEVLSTLRFVSSTPTLFHSGTPHSQLSSCYLNTVEDDLKHIFKVYGDNAQLSKWAGGVGTDWTNVRATGAYVKQADLESQGVIPFLKIANDVTVAINRSGRRRGATAVYLETWHMDIYDFLELRKNTPCAFPLSNNCM